MIDLALARSYYPVCYAFLLATCACASVAVLGAMQIPAFNTFVIAATLLFMDNIKRKETVFDANNLASFVLFSLVFNEERNAHVSADEGQQPVAIACNLIWLVFASLAIVRCEDRAPFCRYLSPNHTAISAMMLTVHSFLFHERESEPVVLLSSTMFVTLSVIWMYTLHVEKLSANKVFDCVPCMVYFGPLMVIQPAMRVLFSVWMSVVLFLLNRTAQSQHGSTESTSGLLTKRGSSENDSDSEAITPSPEKPPSSIHHQHHTRRKKGSSSTPTPRAEDLSRFSIEDPDLDDDVTEAPPPPATAINIVTPDSEQDEVVRMFEEALRQSGNKPFVSLH